MITLFTITLYCLSALLIFKLNANSAAPNASQKRWISLTPALFAIALHAITLRNEIYQPSGLNLSLLTSASLIIWLVCLQILLASIKRPVDALGIAMFPLSAIFVFLGDRGTTNIIENISTGVQSHILISIIAYSLLMLGALQAVVLSLQNKALKNHHPTGWIKKLPPMHDMESFLFQILSFSFICLSLALTTGFLFFDDLFAQHLIHKTILSLIGWAALLILLVGRFQFGWRGKIAIRWTFISFVFILLAYFGSKFVLEVILKS